MPKIQRSAIIPFPAEVLYDIVNDVEAYPRFLPWCGGSKIIRSDEATMEASILMKKGPLNHWFTTRNSLYKNERIEMNLVDGPFKVLRGTWYFNKLDEDATKIALDLTFEFSSGIATSLLTPVFSQIANTMVDSFCARAYEFN